MAIDCVHFTPTLILTSRFCHVVSNPHVCHGRISTQHLATSAHAKHANEQRQQWKHLQLEFEEKHAADIQKDLEKRRKDKATRSSTTGAMATRVRSDTM